MIFARKPDDALASLVKKLDAKVAQIADEKVRDAVADLDKLSAKSSDEKLKKLVKQLHDHVAQKPPSRLAAFVNLLGEDREGLESDARTFAKEQGIQNIPIVVPVEIENGPENFGINPAAEVTVTLYTKLNVKASYAFGEGGLDEAGIEAILADLPKILE